MSPQRFEMLNIDQQAYILAYEQIREEEESAPDDSDSA